MTAKTLLTFILLLSPLPMLLLGKTANSHRSKVLSYIEIYKDIAIKEMHRTGIPASIKLAQAITESGYGESFLALKANNHFGIKCKFDWTGETIYKDDDTTNECFRKYPSVQDSYFDHSQLITTRNHYAFLFKLPPNDYVGWANGLKKAGYATRADYANIIINTIETYNLHIYDNIYTKPIVYAENICLNGKGEWVVISQPKYQTQELGLVLPPTPAQGGFADIFVTGDLVFIDDMLTQVTQKRPKGMEFKCLKGAPAVSIQPEKLRSTFKSAKNQAILLGMAGNNNSKKPTPIEPGRQLNPSFNPSLHLPLAAFQPPVSAEKLTEPAATPKPETTPNTQKPTTKPDNESRIFATVSLPHTPSAQTNTRAAQIPVAATEQPLTTAAEKTQPVTMPEKTSPTYTPNKTITFKPDMSKENLMLPQQKSFNKNGVKAVAYAFAVLPSQIAQTYKLTLTEVLAYNDLQANEPIPGKTNIFLSAKKDKNESAEKEHIVKPNETLWQICQFYGINLSALCQLNKTEPTQTPKAGSTLLLRKQGLQMPKIGSK
ncbi:MAG TPA: glucosaminidase domain-containing protein [Chitinophagales bacterium]|nr:glucosaminidase domain-containing protein [Chitinophagales bacterium]